nr:hypothetical protein [Acidimicrobiia bacterium]
TIGPGATQHSATSHPPSSRDATNNNHTPPDSHKPGPKNKAHITNVWENPLLDRYVLGAATAFGSGRDNCGDIEPKTGGGWTRTCDIYWTEEPIHVTLTDEIIGIIDHRSNNAHGGGYVHIHRDPDNPDGASSTPHRHCLFRDVNGDGDTDDTVDNDGTCAPGDSHEKLTCPKDVNGDGDTADPGEHTGGTCPALAWHPTLPDAGDPWWRTAAQENLITTAVETGFTTGFGRVAGSKWAARFLSASAAARYGRFAGGMGAVAGFGAGMLYAWWRQGDPKPTIPIAGVNGCLDPDDTNWSTKWTADRWQEKNFTHTTTKQAHGYQTRYDHHIAYCEKRQTP